MFFASMLAVIITSVILVVFAVGLIIGGIKKAGDSATVHKVDENSVLKLDIGQDFHEQSEENSLALFSDGDSYVPGIYQAILSIRAAAKDDNIKGIYMEIDEPAMGWSSMEQLRAALSEFKKRGKFIYAYGETIGQRAYYLASVADSIFLNPAGMAELKGLSSESMFFKHTLDKLELEPEIFYAGKFKSATEPFRASEMSEPNKEQIGPCRMVYGKTI